jgi:CBS domain-containing protein
MRDANVDVALVMDGDRLVGIVTSTDLVRSIAADVAAASPTHPARIRDVGPAESGREPLTPGPPSGRR